MDGQTVGAGDIQSKLAIRGTVNYGRACSKQQLAVPRQCSNPEAETPGPTTGTLSPLLSRPPLNTTQPGGRVW